MSEDDRGPVGEWIFWDGNYQLRLTGEELTEMLHLRRNWSENSPDKLVLRELQARRARDDCYVALKKLASVVVQPHAVGCPANAPCCCKQIEPVLDALDEVWRASE